MTYVDALSELDDDEDPWCDLVFDVVEYGIFEQNADSGKATWIKGRALADLRGEVIGFGFEIPLDTWYASRNPEPGEPRFHWSQINLVSIGEATDKLVTAYAMWFDRQEMRRPVAGRFPCSAVSLEDGPPNPLGRKTHFKLFFDGETCHGEISDDDIEISDDDIAAEDSPYAELFFNVDIRAKRAWLLEKDPDYRLPLLRFLTGELSSVPSLPLRAADS